MPRRLVALLATILTLGLVAPGVAPAALAGTDAAAETAFLDLLNQRRGSAGLPALSVAGDLTEVARRHSARMADAVDLHHNAALTNEVSGWQKVGENVGRGPSVQVIHDAFVASPSHDANLVEPDYLQVGIGVEERDGRLWVTQVFRLPSAAPAPTSDEAATAVAGVATQAAATDAETPAAPSTETPAAPTVTEAPAPLRADRATVMLARTEALGGADLDAVLGDAW